jgi:hypothetical protein
MAGEAQQSGGSPSWKAAKRGLEPLDRAYDLSSLSGEVEAVGRGDRSMQQCPAKLLEPPHRALDPVASPVGGPVEGGLAALVGLGGDHRADAAAAGVDWRGHGGLVVVAPSRHASGAATAGSGP